MRKKAAVVHTVVVILEVVALIHDFFAFGMPMFQYYTIDSNILQLVISAAILYYFMRRRDEALPEGLCILHLVSAVCLTVTFLIALLVLAPQEGFAYYFLSDVAPINHFLGPLLSVITFLFMEKPKKLPGFSVLVPMAATLIYGVICVILNYARVLDGPYFFMKVYEESVGTIIMWFAVISVLCLVLSAVYLWVRKRFSQ